MRPRVVVTLICLAATLGLGAPTASAGTSRTIGCHNLYQPDGEIAYRRVSATNISCQTAGRVLQRALRTGGYDHFYPKGSRRPKTERIVYRKRDGWSCTQFFPHLGPPLSDGPTTCRRGSDVARGLYIP